MGILRGLQSFPFSMFSGYPVVGAFAPSAGETAVPTSRPRPHTWYLIPDALFPPSFVFINISGCTFIFESRSQKPGARSQNPLVNRGSVPLPYSDAVRLFSSTSPDAPSYLKSRSQKPGVRSQNPRVPASHIPRPRIRPILCFHQHLRMHLHFLKSRSQEPGARSQNRRVRREYRADSVLRTRSFVFINISGCTFIS